MKRFSVIFSFKFYFEFSCCLNRLTKRMGRYDKYTVAIAGLYIQFNERWNFNFGRNTMGGVQKKYVQTFSKCKNMLKHFKFASSI